MSASPIASGMKYMDGVRAKMMPPPATNSITSSTRNTPIEVRGNQRLHTRDSRYISPAAYTQSQMATPSHVGKPVCVTKSHGT